MNHPFSECHPVGLTYSFCVMTSFPRRIFRSTGGALHEHAVDVATGRARIRADNVDLVDNRQGSID